MLAQRFRFAIRLSVSLIGVLVPLILAVSAQIADVRRVVSDGRAIADQLRPGDRQVVLEINASPPLLAKGEAGQSQLGLLTQFSETVLVAVVEVKRPQLTERQNWIKSLVEARVERVLKPSPKLQLDSGRIIFEEEGGTLTFGQTRVDAVVPWARPLQPGRRYLLFGSVTAEGRFVGSPAGMYEQVDFNTLRRVRTTKSDERDEVEQLIPEAAMDRVSAYVGSRR